MTINIIACKLESGISNRARTLHNTKARLSVGRRKANKGRQRTPSEEGTHL